MATIASSGLATGVGGGDVSAGFTTATYLGSMGIAGIRIHDFLSTGGSDIQIEVSVGAPGSIVVTRIN